MRISRLRDGASMRGLVMEDGEERELGWREVEPGEYCVRGSDVGPEAEARRRPRVCEWDACEPC